MYTLSVRLGRWLPTVLVVPLALVRNFLLGLIPPWMADTQVAPQYVLVTRSSDAVVVARVFAGRDFGDGEVLLEAMSRSLAELTPDQFLETWHATRL